MSKVIDRYIFETRRSSGYKIKLEFQQVFSLKYTHLGKGSPLHTQCLLFLEDLHKDTATIVKHANDEDDQLLAYQIVAGKVLKHSWVKEDRKEILKELTKQLEKDLNE